MDVSTLRGPIRTTVIGGAVVLIASSLPWCRIVGYGLTGWGSTGLANHEVGTTFEVDQGNGTVFSASITAPGDDFDAIVALYDDFLNDEGFEVTKDVLSGDSGQFAFLSGERDDARVDISMSVEDVANDDAGNIIFETLIGLTWTPQG